MNGNKENKFSVVEKIRNVSIEDEDSDDAGDSSEADFTPREYQLELFRAAVEENTIICLGTGTGKTYIAIMMIKQFEEDMKKPFEEEGKRTIFLVPTVPLVEQQRASVERHTFLSVAGYVGSPELDQWTKDKWHDEFKKNHILVMTPAIFQKILYTSYMSLEKVNLLIMDECHKAVGNHPYHEILRCYKGCHSENKPRILGLTACIVNSNLKANQLDRKILELECALHSKAVTVSNAEMISKYGTKPHEIVVLYNSYSLDQNFYTILCFLSSQEKDLKKDSFKKYIREVCNILCFLGPWCAREAASEFISVIENSSEVQDEEDKKHDAAICLKVLRKTVSFCSGCFENISPKDQILNFSSPKLKRLLEILDHHKDLKMCGLVFVDQRIIARIIDRWLKAISLLFPEYSFIKSEFIISRSAGRLKSCKEASMNLRKQETILKSFRLHLYNLIVATSVIEEGMDVPECNVVVRFDFPNDYRAYVQSKGRARSKNSKYIMLVSEAEKEFVKQTLAEYKNVEESLLSKCHQRAVPDTDEISKHFADEIIPPYKPLTEDGSPMITLTSAISVVNSYCKKLPCDKFTTLCVKYDIKPYQTGQQPLFICTVTLPKNSILKERVTGEPMHSKKLAKMAAALKTCQKLHEIGELDERLRPRKRVVMLYGDSDDESESERETDNKEKRYTKAVAEELSASPLKDGSCQYLYLFYSRLVKPLTEEVNWRNNTIFFPEDSPCWFGMVTAKRLPQIPSFPIYTRSGEEEVSVVFLREVNIEEQHLMRMLCLFHKYLLEKVLCFPTNMMHFDPFSAQTGIILVPIVSDGAQGNIDWDFILNILKHKEEPPNPKSFVYNELDFQDAVLKPLYPMYDRSDLFYFISKLRCDLRPDSPYVGEEHVTFREYFKVVHQKDILNENQPLLEMGCTPLRLNLLTPRSLSLKGIKLITKSVPETDKNKVFFVPELCLIHCFSATLWRKAVCIPSIVYRINQLCLAESLRKQISQEVKLGVEEPPEKWPALDFGWDTNFLQPRAQDSTNLEFGRVLSDQVLEDPCAQGYLKSFEMQPDLSSSLGPSPAVLLQALTTSKASDGFDLERLEILGDSFLKLSVSVFLFVKNPDAHEGMLTESRAKIISNFNLFRHGRAKNLCGLIVRERFHPKVNWLPPGYSIPEDQEMMIADRVFVRYLVKENSRIFETSSFEELKQLYEQYLSERQSIQVENLPSVIPHLPFKCSVALPDKSIADSVEALIASYLLVCGPLGALHFLKWLGLKIFSGNIEWPPVSTYNSASVSEDVEDALNIVISKFDFLLADVERIIEYTFKDKYYLLQALTHASYDQNDFTDCYQRLEFLGDAVMDYLVTRYLYDGCKNLTPGELTDVKCALVNNSLLGEVVVKYGLHKYMKYSSSGLFNAISRFIIYLDMEEKAETGCATKVFKEHYLGEEECEELQEVEVPKAFGDLFESIAGAVYLDSRMSLDAVWKVIYRLMGKEIEYFAKHIPKSPVRELLEKYPAAKFSHVVIGQKVRVSLEVEDKLFSILTRSKKVAKTAVAKRALKHFKNQTLKNPFNR